MQRLSFIILFFTASFVLFPNGQSESGRSSVSSVLDDSSYVASSYINMDTLLDDYNYPYSIKEEESLSFHISASYEKYLFTGGPLFIQVAFKANDKVLSPGTDFNYVICINSKGIMENREMTQSLVSAVEKILKDKTSQSSVYLFSWEDESIGRALSLETVQNRVSELTDSVVSGGGEPKEESRKVLETILSNLPLSSKPYKIFWMIDKPLADNDNEWNELQGTIAGLSDSDLEISYAGFNDNFKAQSANRLINLFGGSSYYINDPEDLKSKILEDFEFYNYPAVSDLNIGVYKLTENFPSLEEKRHYSSIGQGEHHLFLTSFPLSPERFLSGNPAENKNTDARALVTYSYFDHQKGETFYGSKEIIVPYTREYREMMDTEDPVIQEHIAIINSYSLIQDIPSILNRDGYSKALILLSDQIEIMTELNQSVQDPLIDEDIQVLRRYKEIIFENRDDVFRSIRLFGDLRKKKY